MTGDWDPAIAQAEMTAVGLQVLQPTIQELDETIAQLESDPQNGDLLDRADTLLEQILGFLSKIETGRGQWARLMMLRLQTTQRQLQRHPDDPGIEQRFWDLIAEAAFFFARDGRRRPIGGEVVIETHGREF